MLSINFHIKLAVFIICLKLITIFKFLCKLPVPPNITIFFIIKLSNIKYLNLTKIFYIILKIFYFNIKVINNIIKGGSAAIKNCNPKPRY
jgi:hypothetical protein